MKRHLLDRLLRWKARDERKPVLIDGARQTGKTYLLSRLLAGEFQRCLRIDFLETPAMAQAFEGSLEPAHVVSMLELLTRQRFDFRTDLLILDEIGECPRAVASLKYFAEQTPQAWIAASGSNIGLLDSFPVGKVEQLQLRPLNFHEFITAGNNAALLQAFESRTRTPAIHQMLFEQLTDYYFTGGMPEAVAAWFALEREGNLLRTEAVSAIHRDLLQGYVRDFGKYAGRSDAQLIAAVFNNIPVQLAKSGDESVQRFRFKNVHQRKSRYAEFENAIEWLHRCRLALKNHPIEGLPRSPLAAYRKDNLVKLFLFDTGLLNHMLGTPYLQIKKQAFEYKGYVAENFVQQELAALGFEPGFSWQDARAEIEFLVSDAQGDIIPVEVKSGIRTRAKSLDSYIQKCQPVRSIKLTGTAGSSTHQNQPKVMPLYDVQFMLD